MALELPPSCPEASSEPPLPQLFRDVLTGLCVARASRLFLSKVGPPQRHLAGRFRCIDQNPYCPLQNICDDFHSLVAS